MRTLLFVLLASSLASSLFGQAAQVATPPSPQPKPAAELKISDAVILGVVEGVTEFLPISSTGHLIIANRFLGLDSNEALFDAAGNPLWYKKPSAEDPGQLLTLKLAADTYIVVIQFGAIAAVAILYWAPLISMLRGLLGRDPAGLRLLRNVLLAFVPAAGIGFVIHDWIDENLFSVGTVIIAQVIGAFLMFAAERWMRARRAELDLPRDSLEMRTVDAVTIGVLQCAALVPGTSRSMMTIVGGYIVGLDPRRAAEFSFLLGFVTLMAASLFKSYKSGTAMIEVFGWSHVLLGAGVAAVTAAVCVRFLVHWLTKHGLGVFAWYRLALAAVLGVLFYL